MTPTGLERNFVSACPEETYREASNPSDVESDVTSDFSPTVTSNKEAPNAPLANLEPGLRFVVRHWPDLSGDNQRAILVIIRLASGEAGY